MRPGGGSSALPPPQPPYQASYWGYTNLAFDDEFTSSATIDVNATGDPGYNWYPLNWGVGGGDNSPAPPGGITPASWYSVSDSVLSFSAATSTPDSGWLNSACYKAGSPGYTGRIWPCGYYIEASIQCNPAGSFSAVQWPAFWSADLNLMTAWLNGSSSNVEGVEIDNIEIFTGSEFACYNHDWIWNGPGWPNSGSIVQNNQGGGEGGPWPDNNFHTIGRLILNPDDNGGNGGIVPYLDNVQVLSAGSTAFHTTGPWSTLYSNPGQIIILGNGYGVSFNFDWVRVWTKP